MCHEVLEEDLIVRLDVILRIVRGLVVLVRVNF